MLVKDKKEFTTGLILGISFIAVLVIMFSPVFNGENAFKAADRLFNKIAKGSTYYIPGVLEETKKFAGTNIEAVIKFDDAAATKKTSDLFFAAGIAVSSANPNELKVSGDLSKMLEAAINDAEAMFHNRGEEIAGKYGFPEREVLFTWWKAFKGIGKDLTKQKKFAEAAFIEEAMKRTVEVSYNFYKIDPESASSKAGILGFSLIFYVIYTMWWGFAILLMAEGMGLKMKAGHKKET